MMKGKEGIYLSITIAFAFLFFLFCLPVNVIDNIYESLRTYTSFPHSEYFFKVVLIFLTITILLLYRYWNHGLKKEKELDDIISSIHPDVLIVANLEGKIIRCSRSVKNMFDYDAEEIINRKTFQSILDIKSKQRDEK